MTTAQLIENLAEVLLAGPTEVTGETRLESLSGWDSMGQLAILSFLDEQLGATLPVGSLQKCQTLADITELVKGKLSD
jgi:acyl carrier protein